RQRFDLDVLVPGVSAVTDRAKSVERRNSERSGEIAVRSAARAALAELEPELAGHGPRPIVQTRDGACAFQRRALEPTGNFKPDPRIACLPPADALVHQLHLFARRRPAVHAGLRPPGDHAWPAPA